ncbi:MerR family DNA-binding transcriptional regulator [Blautia producta]|uniref:MerR family DNA-binding transcriptional regulator n=1 Tax=Blautia producta TaxID=33035 RepID=UPI0031B63D4C
MGNLLRIGQVCKLYGISLDTLRYYDKIGLLKPFVTEPSGYRYYSFEQLDILEMIIAGRSLDIPLENLQKRLVSGKIEDYMLLVEEQQAAIEERKKALEQLENHSRQMVDLLTEITLHQNDINLQNIHYETLDKEICQIPVEAFPPTGFDGNDAGSFLQMEQWSFYQSDSNGIVAELPQEAGISCQNEECTRKMVSKSGSMKMVKVTGTYGKIKFWGKNKELHTYLNKICRNLNLWDAQLLVKYIFALAHEDLDNEYFVEIYFPIQGSGR